MTPEQLSERIRAGDSKAVAFIVRHVKRNAGDLSLAAFAMGIHRRTLDRWGKEVPALAEALRPLRVKSGPRPKSGPVWKEARK